MPMTNKVNIPQGVEVRLSDGGVHARGSLGEGRVDLHETVRCTQEGEVLTLAPGDSEKQSSIMTGTTRALVANLLIGVSRGFEKRLELVGVGYRARMRGDVLNLQLGYSHPIDYPVRDGVRIETPSQTEIVVKGTDKQKVGQVAAEIRAFRPPEPYKGKGVKYSGEQIIRKEAKKK